MGEGPGAGGGAGVAAGVGNWSASATRSRTASPPSAAWSGLSDSRTLTSVGVATAIVPSSRIAASAA